MRDAAYIGRYEEVDTGFESPCHLWKGATQSKGYASIGVGNKRTGLVHRMVYEAEHGALDAGHHVHHRCEQKTCIRPDHLEATDPHRHAQEHSTTTREQVWTIRATHAVGSHKVREIARELGLEAHTVYNIVKGKRWVGVEPPEGHPPLPPGTGTVSARMGKLTREQAADIKGRPNPGRGHAAALAREFGVSAVAISNILNGKAHRDVEPLIQEPA